MKYLAFLYCLLKSLWQWLPLAAFGFFVIAGKPYTGLLVLIAIQLILIHRELKTLNKKTGDVKCWS